MHCMLDPGQRNHRCIVCSILDNRTIRCIECSGQDAVSLGTLSTEYRLSVREGTELKGGYRRGYSQGAPAVGLWGGGCARPHRRRAGRRAGGAFEGSTRPVDQRARGRGGAASQSVTGNRPE
eukprot:5228961-Pyramimonas_sp.AAC.1